MPNVPDQQTVGSPLSPVRFRSIVCLSCKERGIPHGIDAILPCGTISHRPVRLAPISDPVAATFGPCNAFCWLPRAIATLVTKTLLLQTP